MSQCGEWNNWCQNECGPWNNWCFAQCGAWNNWCRGVCGPWNGFCSAEAYGPGRGGGAARCVRGAAAARRKPTASVPDGRQTGGQAMATEGAAVSPVTVATAMVAI